MMIVRVIFVETTFPVRMRPRIEISPVNGHFLSRRWLVPGSYESILEHTNICAVDGFRRCFETQTDILVPPLFFGRDLLATFINPVSDRRNLTTESRTAGFCVLEEMLLLESFLDLGMSFSSYS
jgi:hypothetical protein